MFSLCSDEVLYLGLLLITNESDSDETIIGYRTAIKAMLYIRTIKIKAISFGSPTSALNPKNFIEIKYTDDSTEAIIMSKRKVLNHQRICFVLF